MTYQKHTEQELARLQAYMQEYGFTICEESNDSEDDQTYSPISFSLQDVYASLRGERAPDADETDKLIHEGRLLEMQMDEADEGGRA